MKQNRAFVATFALFALLLASSVFAKPKQKEERRIVVLNPVLQNLDASEEYCAPLTRGKLESNLREYTAGEKKIAYSVVSITDEEAIKAFQAANSGDSFSNDACIELQRLTGANCAVTFSIIRTKKGFITTANFVDLLAGTKIASTNPVTRETEDLLYEGAACAVDELTNELCSKIGVTLTASQVIKLKGSDQAAADDAQDAQDIVIQSEADCQRAGYKMFAPGKEAEDNIVIKNKSDVTYEIDIWANHRKKGFKHFGSITIKAKKGYKNNPLDKDLDQYTAIYMKVTNVKANIINDGDRHGDQYFRIEPM